MIRGFVTTRWELQRIVNKARELEKEWDVGDRIRILLGTDINRSIYFYVPSDLAPADWDGREYKM